MKIKLILTIIVLTIVNGFDVPSSSGDIGDGEYFESCAKWTICTLEDKDAYNELNECKYLIPIEKLTKMLKIMGDSVKREWSDLETAYNDYCGMDEDKQNEFFTDLVQFIVEEYSSTCADFMQAVTCKKMTDMNDCLILILSRLHGEGKC
nr:uncharacterized protein LOC107437099 [Parasteatoda tepidariorum]